MVCNKREIIRSDNSFLKVALLLSILFVVKGIIYSIYIIPPAMGISPDDMGHLSYVKFIVNEQSLPILFQSTMDKVIYQSYLETEKGIWKNLTLNQYFEPSVQLNWIAQHPPLYYLLIAPVYKIASFFTSSLSLILIAIRLFTLSFGLLTLIYLYKLMELIDIKLWIKCCILFSFVFNSAIQWCFTNITNDSLLILLSTATLYYLINYINTYTNKSYFLFVFCASLIVLTKYTGIILLIPFILFFSYKEISRNGFNAFLRKAFLGIFIGLSLTAALLIRNYDLFGDFFPVAQTTPQYNRTNITIFQFLTKVPYFDDLYWNICGLLGWTHFIRANVFIKMFAALLVLISGMFSLQNIVKKKYKLTIAFLGLIAFFLQYKIYNFFFSTALALTGILILLIATIVTIKEKNNKEIILFFEATIVFYFIVFFFQHYNAYLIHGQIRATHGRYYYILFFPVCYLVFNQFAGMNSLKLKISSIILLVSLVILEFLLVEELFVGLFLVV